MLICACEHTQRARSERIVLETDAVQTSLTECLRLLLVDAAAAAAAAVEKFFETLQKEEKTETHVGEDVHFDNETDEFDRMS